MVAGSVWAVRFRDRHLSYGDACAIARRVFAAGSWRPVHLHLTETTATSTAALARLILLRRELLGRGGDLRLVGLKGRAEALYEINRLDKLLPRVPSAES